MATPASSHVPEGMHTLTAHLWFNGNGSEAVEFYRNALGAELIGTVVPGAGGKGVMHATLRIGDSCVMMADAFPGSWETGPAESATVGMWIYTEDCDALMQRAVDAGR